VASVGCRYVHSIFERRNGIAVLSPVGRALPHRKIFFPVMPGLDPGTSTTAGITEGPCDPRYANTAGDYSHVRREPRIAYPRPSGSSAVNIAFTLRTIRPKMATSTPPNGVKDNRAMQDSISLNPRSVSIEISSGTPVNP
jgi:hypothetical protein